MPCLLTVNRDWKKLTFYYFADSYINFNSLVTDLFKVYKTRIWMSAMNPASFAHPAGPGSGVLPSLSSGAMGSGLAAIGENTKDTMPPQFAGLNPNYNGFAAPAGPHGSNMHSSFGGPRGPTQPNGLHAPPTAAMSRYPGRHSPHSIEPQFGLNGYGPSYPNGVPGMPSQPGLFGGPDHLAPNGVDQAWMGLQGLSLNSH